MKQSLVEKIYQTNKEGFIDITLDVNNFIEASKIKLGVIVISTKHTSCSLTLNENADPRVLNDLATYIKSIVPEEGHISLDGSQRRMIYTHSDEGIDDMPAHIKTMLTCTSLSLSVNNGKLLLGTWQAIYLWEHRYTVNLRKINFHILGD